jgi:hypothetical protein
MGRLISITTTATVELNAPTAHVEDPKKRRSEEETKACDDNAAECQLGIQARLHPFSSPSDLRFFDSSTFTVGPCSATVNQAATVSTTATHLTPTVAAQPARAISPGRATRLTLRDWAPAASRDARDRR